jgi:hypothetical protein
MQYDGAGVCGGPPQVGPPRLQAVQLPQASQKRVYGLTPHHAHMPHRGTAISYTHILMIRYGSGA